MTVESELSFARLIFAPGTDKNAAARQRGWTLPSYTECNGAEVGMPHSRERSPGSFRDELGVVIDRVAPKERDDPKEPAKARKQSVGDTGRAERPPLRAGLEKARGLAHSAGTPLRTRRRT
jgi:hypothetical protein